LYTAPAWVVLLAWRFLGEPLGWRRLLAVGGAFVGCGLMARAYDPGALVGSWLGIALGLASGLGFAAYNVLSKHALADRRPLAVPQLGGVLLVILSVVSLRPSGELAAAAEPAPGLAG